MRSIYTEAFNIARTNDTSIDDGFVCGEKLSRDMQHGQEIKSEVRPSNQGISGLATLKTLRRDCYTYIERVSSLVPRRTIQLIGYKYDG